MSWPKGPFESLFAIPSKNGLTRPSKVRGTGIRMVNMGELFAHDRIGPIDMERVPVSDREVETMLLEEGDLLFARQSLVLAGAGKCSIVAKIEEPTTFESHIIRVRLDKRRANPAFYHQYFKSPACGISSIVTQGVQAGIRGSDLKQLAVALPPLDVQSRVSELLSSYDDLIENNRRRIQLLEESARLLYCEWFVHLRFPGHEHVRVVNGVPDGWRRKPLGDSIVLNYGKALKAENRIDGSYPVYGSSGIVGTHHQALVAGPTIIVGRKGNVGSIYWSTKNCHPIDTVYFIDAASSSLYLYYALKHMQFVSTDVAVPGLNRDFAYSRPLLAPKQSVLDAFLDSVGPVHRQIDKLEEMNGKLAQARDLLLPRLMSGAISL